MPERPATPPTPLRRRPQGVLWAFAGGRARGARVNDGAANPDPRGPPRRRGRGSSPRVPEDARGTTPRRRTQPTRAEGDAGSCHTPPVPVATAVRPQMLGGVMTWGARAERIGAVATAEPGCVRGCGRGRGATRGAAGAERPAHCLHDASEPQTQKAPGEWCRPGVLPDGAVREYQAGSKALSGTASCHAGAWGRKGSGCPQ